MFLLTAECQNPMVVDMPWTFQLPTTTPPCAPCVRLDWASDFSFAYCNASLQGSWPVARWSGRAADGFTCLFHRSAAWTFPHLQHARQNCFHLILQEPAESITGAFDFLSRSNRPVGGVRRERDEGTDRGAEGPQANASRLQPCNALTRCRNSASA